MGLNSLIFAIYSLFLFAHYGEPAKIGIFTAAFSKSQMVFNLRIAETLVADNHEVVLIRPEYNADTTSLKSKNPKIHTKGAPEGFKKFSDLSQKEMFEGLGWREFMDLSNAYKGMVVGACKEMLANDEFIEKIKAEKIELAFHHHIDFCEHGIAHAVGIKKWVATMPGPAHSITLRDLGIPYFDVYLPNIMANMSTEMSFMDRVKTVAGNVAMTLLGPLQIDNPTTELMREKFGKDFIHISDLRKTALLTFVNNDPFLEYPYPHTQKIQFIGGLGTQDSMPLQEPFASFAQKAKKIVLVSFGSVVVASEMPQSWRKALIEVFEKNPEIAFVWKFEEDSFEVPKNVLRSKWIPQNDLLALDKTAAFITHGGYNSLGEAVQSGTPCVFVPLIGDQFRNSMLAQYRGIGLQLSKTEFTFANLQNKLQTILKDPKFLQNVKKHQSLTTNRLNSPDKILRHWTNLALHNDLSYLSLPKMGAIQLYNLDVYLAFLVAILVILFILKTVIRWMCSLCCKLRKRIQKSKTE